MSVAYKVGTIWSVFIMTNMDKILNYRDNVMIFLYWDIECMTILISDICSITVEVYIISTELFVQ